MAVLRNAKHERFAQELAKGASAVEAYAKSGYKPNRSHASRLVANGNVRARVEELQAKVAKKTEVTVESLSSELEEARTIAIAEKQSSAAVQATMGKAKLFGLGVENRRMSGTIGLVNITAKDLEALTDNELVDLERAYPVLQKLGLVGGDKSANGSAPH